VMGGATGSSPAQLHLPNPATCQTHLVLPLPRVHPLLPAKSSGKFRQQSGFRMPLRALPSRGRNRQPVSTHPPRTCARRRALPTLPLELPTVTPRVRMGRRRQQFARIARRRIHRYGGGIQRGSLCATHADCFINCTGLSGLNLSRLT